MTSITLQIVDGYDRGRTFSDLSLPVTIGREEGNSIQLNDDRISRFHLKIQEDHGQIVLTDLESTNGTKVNGGDVQLRILRYGDMIILGRSVLVFGSPEQIAGRLARIRGDAEDERTVGPEDEQEGTDPPEAPPSSSSLEFELNWSSAPDQQQTLHSLVPPDLPGRLSPGQAAQLSELLEYLHMRVRNLLATALVNDDDETITLDQRQWQNLLHMQGQLARYLLKISHPSE